MAVLNVQSVSRIKKSVVIEDAALLLNRYVMPGHRIAMMDDNKRREGIKISQKKERKKKKKKKPARA
jgi:hypothetical protein